MPLTIHEINTISTTAILENKLSFISGIDLLARTKNLKAVVKLSERHIIQIWEFKARLFKKQKSKSPGAIHTWNNCIPTITNTQIPIWTETNCYQTESSNCRLLLTKILFQALSMLNMVQNFWGFVTSFQIPTNHEPTTRQPRL